MYAFDLAHLGHETLAGYGGARYVSTHETTRQATVIHDNSVRFYLFALLTGTKPIKISSSNHKRHVLGRITYICTSDVCWFDYLLSLGKGRCR